MALSRALLLLLCAGASLAAQRPLLPSLLRTPTPFAPVSSSAAAAELNVLGTPLQLCCSAPATGFRRDGYCTTGPQDAGVHVVCAVVNAEFLAFTKSRGNDLSTPRPGYQCEARV